MIVAMPRDGAIIFSDLIGKLDVLRVACEKCGRDGSYRLNALIEKRGRDAKLIDWLDEIATDLRKEASRQYERSIRRTVPAIAQGVVESARCA